MQAAARPGATGAVRRSPAAAPGWGWGEQNPTRQPQPWLCALLPPLVSELHGLSPSAEEADGLAGWFWVLGLSKSIDYKENYKNSNKRNGLRMLPPNPPGSKSLHQKGHQEQEQRSSPCPAQVCASPEMVCPWVTVLSHADLYLFKIKQRERLAKIHF